ncbi:ATP-binding response regulator [Gloeothece verrucosa]|uniref:Circadian input-output histidine kinase CikA n=1 Tax=Gloeothece verrucosa (strain PCC 7822) TaxID=497965 RepID=E0U946_GLOV7|nr:ATP-binding protein [Gloeothece verrucosa]ADN17304.1 response regulator receiver sensor signal transduction histidine kinase [Gloeothece verrucosa PCC 7822]
MRDETTALTILLIDDDEVDRMAVRRALKKAGVAAQFYEATDAEEALELVSETTFDCIFLDYRLPDYDGLDLIKQFKAMGIQVPLIVLTGQGDEQIAVEMMKAGASDYLSKSRVSSETLSQTLRNALRVYQAEQEAAQANLKLRETNELLKEQNQKLERQRRQIELQNEQLQETSRLKSQFLATMSHELRTPINAIMGFSQMLLRKYPEPLTCAQTDLVQRIFDNSKNLLTLLNDVLHFSKIEAGKLLLHPTELDLKQLTVLTTEELRSLAVSKNLSLQIKVELENPQIVNDQSCLRRILVNLLSNAIKFTESGGVWVNVWEMRPDWLAIAVKDTGIGIAEEQLEHIFEVFRQADQTLTRKYGGTGLGLAISESLTKMMQGKISVTSELGKGSIFQIEFPRKINS